jgi:tryptophan synthase alpha chain
VVYFIDDGAKLVTIARVAHQREVYEWAQYSGRPCVQHLNFRDSNPSLRSGFRQRAPAPLTPAGRLNFGNLTSAICNNSFMPFHFDNRPSLVAYVTCGDPDLATTREVILATIDAGASIIELGVPFSDPLADGPVIQRASERALKHGTTLEQVLKLAAEIREHSQSAGLIVFSYLNPILRMGVEKFCKVARHAGIDGTLITDLPVEESADYLRGARKNDLATIFLAAPTSTDQRLKEIAKVSTGFIYAISRTGVTGARRQMPEDARGLVKRIRRFTKLPIAVGFGISTPDQFAAVGTFAEGAVIGSAIVRQIEQNPGREAASVAEFVRQLLALGS